MVDWKQTLLGLGLMGAAVTLVESGHGFAAFLFGVLGLMALAVLS